MWKFIAKRTAEKNTPYDRKSWKKGFSLVEVLVAICILAVITIPLAGSFISSTRLNSRSNAMETASNVSNSILETMQKVSLEDVLKDVNGYSTDQQGNPLEYTLTKNTLADYTVGSTYEAKASDDGTSFSPVVKQEDVALDAYVTSSINTRVTGDVVRTYFSGQDDDKYSFVMKNVKSGADDLDVLVQVEPEKTFDVVNILQMNRSDILTYLQKTSQDKDVANEYVRANATYKTLNKNDSSIELKSVEWFLEHMTKTITINLVQDRTTEAATATITYEYHVDGNVVKEADRTITKKVASFSTNGTSEYINGVYLYYYPYLNSTRDTIVINNKNELGIPVHLIAVAEGKGAESEEDIELDFTGYRPTLEVNELSTQLSTEAKVTVCSNVEDTSWNKTVTPAGKTVTVKGLGNSSEQQTMNHVTVSTYIHKDSSFDENGDFVPNDKYLLSSVSGSIIDNSVKQDLDSDRNTGITVTRENNATASSLSITYNGTEQTGVTGKGVNWSGTISATEAGSYVAYATPDGDHCWADGSVAPKEIKWTIKRASGSTASAANRVYNRTEQTGVAGVGVTWTGTTKATKAGSYTAYATPDANHAWEDGSYGSKSVTWNILPITVGLKWGQTSWTFDNQKHSTTCTATGVLSGDECTVTLQNNSILSGTKTVTAVKLSNSNYVLPDNVSTTLTVTGDMTAFVNLAQLTYNGTAQNVIESSQGVSISGITSSTNAGSYEFTASPKDGFTWEDGTTSARKFTWSIAPKSVTLKWGETKWTYDGYAHSTTCEAVGLLRDDSCDVILTNNYILNAGSVLCSATSVSNSNYSLAKQSSTTLTVTRNPIATYTVATDLVYNGLSQTGVTYEYCYASLTTQATDAGTYTARLTPLENYAWEDGTVTAKTITWKIAPVSVATYEVATDLVFNQTEQTGVTGENVNFGGTVSATNAGTYTATVTPDKNYTWADGTTDEKSVTWTIERFSVFPPYIETDPNLNGGYTEYVYTGELIEPVIQGYYPSIMNQDGVASAIDYGTYAITWSLKDDKNYVWSDGTTEAKVATWTINPAPMEYTEPTAKEGLVYNETNQELIVPGESNDGTFYYRIGTSGSYTTDIPKKTDAGTYEIYWYLKATKAGSVDTEKKSFTVTIDKATPTYTTPSNQSILCGQSVSSVQYKGGTIQYLVLPSSVGSSEWKNYYESATWSSTVPTLTGTGTYWIYFKIDENNNYYGVSSDYSKGPYWTVTVSHNYGDWYEKVAPTCTTAGTDERKCSGCGHTETKTGRAALGHNSVNGGTADAHKKCSRCGKVLDANHSYTVDSGVQYKAATCTTARVNYKRCACGYNPKSSSYVVTSGSALGHSWSAWDQVVSWFTVTKAGQEVSFRVYHSDYLTSIPLRIDYSFNTSGGYVNYQPQWNSLSNRYRNSKGSEQLTLSNTPGSSTSVYKTYYIKCSGMGFDLNMPITWERQCTRCKKAETKFEYK